MRVCGRLGKRCTALIALILLGGFDQTDASTPERTTTIARVEALMVQIEKRRRRSKQYGLMSVLDLESSLANWRPRHRRHYRNTKIQRMSTAPEAIVQLISNAICRSDAASLRIAHRLDALLHGQLFDRIEVMIANDIAHQLGINIDFQPRLMPIGHQSLQDINRVRRLKRAISNRHPRIAIKLVPSFQMLCRIKPTK